MSSKEHLVKILFNFSQSLLSFSEREIKNSLCNVHSAAFTIDSRILGLNCWAHCGRFESAACFSAFYWETFAVLEAILRVSKGGETQRS